MDSLPKNTKSETLLVSKKHVLYNAQKIKMNQINKILTIEYVDAKIIGVVLNDAPHVIASLQGRNDVLRYFRSQCTPTVLRVCFYCTSIVSEVQKYIVFPPWKKYRLKSKDKRRIELFPFKRRKHLIIKTRRIDTALIIVKLFINLMRRFVTH